jgi:GT2 family glycosyltransferase
MIRVSVGIHVHAQPQQLYATLAGVRRNTEYAVQIVLLPDGPDAETKAALSKLDDLLQLATDQPLGAPACFNRLVTSADADLYVLLESGSLVGPGWLAHLVAALDADPAHGLAGPSTNSAWNQQAVFPHNGGTQADLVRACELLRQGFHPPWRTLEPLHSLADFCYAVKREVVEAVGAADEGYGLGPCWEMDYNIRAARAGFRGVWACHAYVYRCPMTPRRQSEDARLFPRSKQRYQDKFCGRRLRGEQQVYELHCRGDACPFFAPPELIQITLPLSTTDRLGAPSPHAAPAGEAQAAISGQGTASCSEQQPTSVSFWQEAGPLISCIMPTRGKAEWVLQSIRYFQRQDYPARELIIVDDGVDDLASKLPDDPCIWYLRSLPGQSIGAKRNQACAVARGEIIAQWDDDDWYAPDRLSAQVAPLLAGTADITALTSTLFFDLEHWEFWRCTPQLYSRLFVGDVHGGTLVYWRRVWQVLAHYPDRSLAEDAFFLVDAGRRGARIDKIPGEKLFLYLRHGGNAWSFRCGQYLDPSGWQRVPEPFLPGDDRAFYAGRSAAGPELRQADAPLPLAAPA